MFASLWFFALKYRKRKPFVSSGFSSFFYFCFSVRRPFSPIANIIISCSSLLHLHSLLQPIHACERAQIVDSELNVHLSQVYSCVELDDGARRCDFYDYLQHFFSPLSLLLCVYEWCFVCGQRALCTH